MKVEFVTNASMLITLSDGRKLLTDPWYYAGAYFGAWDNFPPLANRERYIKSAPDFIYISHLHPDHLDKLTLAHFSKDTEFWLPKFPHPHLTDRLRSFGFNNLVLFEIEKPTAHHGVEVTLFGDFSQTSPDASPVTYSLDSSLWVKDSDGTNFFNVNDNTIFEAEAKRIRELYGRPDIAVVPAAGASLFPNAFQNYTDDEKLLERDRLRERMSQRFVDVARALKPRWIIPAAGSYVYRGKLAKDSVYLHQPTPSQLTDFWNRSDMVLDSLRWLYEGDVLNSETGGVQRNPNALLRDFTSEQRTAYSQTFEKEVLPHELIRIPDAFEIPWTTLLRKARENLWAHQEKYKAFLAWDLELISVSPRTGKKSSFAFPLDSAEFDIKLTSGRGTNSTRGYFRIEIDENLLLMALVRAAHWDLIQGGALVDVYRSPDEYVPTIHILLSFFHL